MVNQWWPFSLFGIWHLLPSCHVQYNMITIRYTWGRYVPKKGCKIDRILWVLGYCLCWGNTITLSTPLSNSMQIYFTNSPHYNYSRRLKRSNETATQDLIRSTKSLIFFPITITIRCHRFPCLGMSLYLEGHKKLVKRNHNFRQQYLSKLNW